MDTSGREVSQILFRICLRYKLGSSNLIKGRPLTIPNRKFYQGIKMLQSLCTFRIVSGTCTVIQSECAFAMMDS